MFWGLVLKANKRYSQVVTKAFHVSHATLDLQSGNITDNDAIQVWVSSDETNHLLCNLNKSSSHVQLDLAFSEGETIAFFSKGTGTIHLTGFLLPEEPDYDLGGLGGEEEDDISDEENETVELLSKKPKGKLSKALLEQEADEGASSDEDDEDDDDIDLDEDDLLEEDDDSEDDDEGEDETDDDEDSEEVKTGPPSKVAKLDKSVNQNGLTNGKAPKPEKQQSKNEKKKEQKETNKANQSQQKPNQQQKVAAKTLVGGVAVEDLRPGKGPEAKPGKKVQVYYEGRLKSNNKVFDSTKAGQGFAFVLGRGEVIRGWDVGVAGMKVGGKRRITCPPNAAYGAKGSPPVIPPNSTLVFDVELRGVN